ncbi:MAG: mevalonate kinase family protein [Solirubrobacteraceae bacterium]
MASGRALARAALAGNPSDGYGGAVLAVCVPELAARAEATSTALATSDPPSALVDATVARFGRGPCTVRWTTTVPREVGLGGSSAIVTATVRALCALHGRALAPDELAEMVLAVEVDDLGIAAGPQDRYAQAHEGLVLMDFAGARPRVERLDPALLPALYLAWRSDAAEASHAVHGGLRDRAREPDVRAGMARLAGHARAARDALLGGDHQPFADALDASYDERAALLTLDPRHVAMVHAARAAGASANYAGSGGGIVGTLPLDGFEPVGRALRALGCEVIVPGFAPMTRLAPSHRDRGKAVPHVRARP